MIVNWVLPGVKRETDSTERRSIVAKAYYSVQLMLIVQL